MDFRKEKNRLLCALSVFARNEMKNASVVHVRFHAFDLTRDIVCRAASALGKGVGTGNRIKIKTKIRNKIENSGSG